MKRGLILLMAILSTTALLSAQSMLDKVTKLEAKEHKKNGWRTIDGEPTMEQQLVKTYEYQTTYDEYGAEKYLIACGIGLEETHIAAMASALKHCEIDAFSILGAASIILSNNKNGEATLTPPTPSTGFKLAPQIMLSNFYRPKDGKIEVRIICAYERSKCVVPKR